MTGSRLCRPLAARRHLAQARRHLDEGDVALAVAAANMAIAADSGADAARAVLASVELADYGYRDVLGLLHEHLKPRSYVEIGLSEGKSFALAGPSTQAVGVDPAPALAGDIAARHRIYRQTSDAFFAKHTRDQVLDSPVELAFIDGMHLFEFALRDFINLERWAAPTGLILLHDTYPFDAVSANRRTSSPEVTALPWRALLRSVNHFSNFWTGDIWRVVLILRMYRPDLHIVTLPALPTGLTLVSNLNPTSTVLESGYRTIVEWYRGCPFEAVATNKRAVLCVEDRSLDLVLELL
jgi:hypothetical protein